MNTDSLDQPMVVTKTVFSVVDFVNWQRGGLLNLRPHFQRGSVWTPKAKSYLIDTLLRGFPIPVIYLQNVADGDSYKNVRQVVDGQQRLRTLISFIDASALSDRESDDEFTLLRAHNQEFAGAGFQGLKKDLRDRLLFTDLSVHVLPSNLEDRTILDLFARMNSTGERLNDQELRNAEYHGVFKSAMYRLAYDQLDFWKSTRAFSNRSIAQMKNVEFTSELVLYQLNGLQAKSKASLDKAYKSFDEDFPFEVEVDANFQRAFDLLVGALARGAGGKPFKRVISQSWIYTVFSLIINSTTQGPLSGGGAWTFQAPQVNTSTLNKILRMLEGRLESDLELPTELEKALRGASTDKSSRESRMAFLRELL